MKKSVFVIVATMFLMSCGGSSNSTAATDSTVVDSTKVVDSAVAGTDSTVAQIPADSTSAK
jgi:uncharacterized protein YcfL